MKAFTRWARIKNDLDEYRAPTALKANPHPLPEGIAGVYSMIEAAESDTESTLVALCGLCGLRISEARSIRASNIDPLGMTLKVRGKGDKERQVPLSESTWHYLMMLYCKSKLAPGGDGLFFAGIGDRTARKMITDIGERAGISRRVASHDLRATFATEIFNRTKNIRAVQELLGHSSVAITEIYLGVSNVQLRQAVSSI